MGACCAGEEKKNNDINYRHIYKHGQVTATIAQSSMYFDRK